MNNKVFGMVAHIRVGLNRRRTNRNLFTAGIGSTKWAILNGGMAGSGRPANGVQAE